MSTRSRAAWGSCLDSAARTALACTIVGGTTLYGPASFQRQLAFPAFTYVTVILVVTDATLGDTIRGCLLALYATVQSIGPAILSFWVIGPTRFSSGTTALAVALGGFVVALPESTHLISKRIALGQIVIVYVIGFINGEETEAVMHPVHVAASTALGVLACVLALLLPYPRLACCEVRKNCNLYAENASERLKLFVKAFCAEDSVSALASLSQAKPLTIAGSKILRSIKCYQESMQWERVPIKLLKPYFMSPGDRLQDLEMYLRGIEMGLNNTTFSFPVRMLDVELKEGLHKLEEHIGLTIKQAKGYLPYDSLTVPESNAENIMKSLKTLQKIPPTHQDLPPFFFLFCMKLIHTKSLAKKDNSVPKNKTPGFSFQDVWSNWSLKSRTKRLMPAFKCSLSLGLAVLFGLIYSKENGHWSGLPVAISLASAREPAFRAANAKTQGTVIGTVYGVLGFFVFEKLLPIRFLSLLPWFIFCTFLRRSKMYGPAGGISAIIGAVVLLGRTNFGTPSDFAIARIVETFIGLSCSIMVDILLQPTRASTLSRAQLSESLGALQECIGSINFFPGKKGNLLESQKRLKSHVNELGNLIGEAEVEPNFWFLPFHSACYGKLLGSLSKIVDLLLFGAHALRFLEEETGTFEALFKEVLNKIDGDLEHFKKIVGSSIKYSLTVLDQKEIEKNNISCDLEMGDLPNLNVVGVSDFQEDEMEKIMNSYLQHSKEAVDKIFHVVEGEKKEDVKISETVLSLCALGYCMSSLSREIRKMEKQMKELVQWENSSSPT